MQIVGRNIYGPYGSLEIRNGSTPIHAGYTYTADGALFIGDHTFSSTQLSFAAVNVTATNVLVLYNPRGVRVMASGDTRAWLNITSLATHLSPRTAVVSGRSGWWSWQTHGGNCILEVLLLEGEELHVNAKL